MKDLNIAAFRLIFHILKIVGSEKIKFQSELRNVLDSVWKMYRYSTLNSTKNLITY